MNKRTASDKKTLMTLAGSIAMLAIAFLLPLVNLKSYRFMLTDLPHKIDRLVHDDTSQTVAYVLLAGIVLAPVLLAVTALLWKKAAKAVAWLPVVFSLALTVALLLAKAPNPGIGLWIYLAVAGATLNVER